MKEQGTTHKRARNAAARKHAEAERDRLLAALERRNLQLQTAAQVSRAASGILDPEVLMQQVVDLVRERFDLYYVGIFLVDQTGEWARGPNERPAPGRWAVLWAGTGEEGRKMLEQGHKLEIGDTSMIGWCVAHKQARIALDVGEDAVRFDNPLLPCTRSELALPLISRNEVIGAMTVQSAQEAAFSAEDITILQTMADQLANAIQNARLYRQAQRELAERIRAETALRQHAAELQARNEELDTYAHTVAHDLKEPISAIIFTAELMEMHADALPEEKRLRYLHSIRDDAFRMNNIINELLLLAGVRKMDVEATALDMKNIVSGALQRLTLMIEEHQAEIGAPPSWPIALGYGPWVEEIWVNYISNAIKYGGRPPRIELGAEELPDGRARFWVRDNGPGLDEEEKARLFTPFTRLDQARAKGTGLGLSIVRRIVEKLGGQVGVESKPGHGCVFFFTLPRRRS